MAQSRTRQGGPHLAHPQLRPRNEGYVMSSKVRTGDQKSVMSKLSDHEPKRASKSALPESLSSP